MNQLPKLEAHRARQPRKNKKTQGKEKQESEVQARSFKTISRAKANSHSCSSRASSTGGAAMRGSKSEPGINRASVQAW